MKDTAVKEMFETIATGYDFQNSFLSLRRDVHWRRALAETLDPPPGGLILDVAVGTAETALAIWHRHRHVRIVGIDFSPAMLEVGRRKLAANHPGAAVYLCTGDGRWLPIRSGCADIVTISFGIRNVEERHAVLAEFHRVLKPGGRLYIMEFGYPDQPLLYRLYRFYFEHILPPLGNLISRTDYAYTYLADSVDTFPHDERFLAEIGHAGFGGLETIKLTFGIAKIYCGCKEE